MTLASFLYLIAAIFAIEASLQFFAACEYGRSNLRRVADLAFGAAGVAIACAAVRYAAGLP